MTTISKIKVNALFGRERAQESGRVRLDILLPRDWPQSPTPLHWRWHPNAGETQSGHGSIEELPKVGTAPVRVWTPATETLLTHATLPTRSRTKLEQALPYALEEQLLDDPSQLHFAWRREDDGTVHVGVTAKTRIREWLDAFTRAGIKPAVLCPSTLAIPWSPDCWSVAFIEDELVVRTGPASGFSCAVALNEPPALLLTNLKEARLNRGPEYVILFQPPAELPTEVWGETLGVPIRTESQSFWDIPGDSEPALNLLQGEFAGKSELHKELRRWLPAAAMLALWIIGAIVFDVAEWWQLHRQHRENVREMNALLMSAFPETKTILDPAQQMQRGLEMLQARGGMRTHDMLPLLTKLAPAWQPGSRIRLRGLRYGDRALTLELTAPDPGTIENLRLTLQSNGLQAELRASTPHTGEVDARLHVQPLNVSGVKP